jgi:hypothetical protein
MKNHWTYLVLFHIIMLSCADNNSSISETLNYINTTLSENSCRCVDRYGNDWGCINRWSLSDNGLAKITYETNISSREYRKTTSFYLRNIEVVSLKQEGDCYSIIIRCKAEVNCMLFNNLDNGTSTNTIEISDIKVNNEKIAVRLKEAIQYLLELANKNNRFLEKDPFDK